MPKKNNKRIITGVSAKTSKGYISKRVLQRAITKGMRHISDDVLAKRGFIVTTRGDKVVKVFKDGTTEDMATLNKVKRPNHIDLD